MVDVGDPEEWSGRLEEDLLTVDRDIFKTLPYKM